MGWKVFGFGVCGRGFGMQGLRLGGRVQGLGFRVEACERTDGGQAFLPPVLALALPLAPAPPPAPPPWFVGCVRHHRVAASGANTVTTG